MTIKQRIETLRERHAELERKLDDEQSRPHPDEEVLRSIKHEKLILKDEISRLSQEDAQKGA